MRGEKQLNKNLFIYLRHNYIRSSDKYHYQITCLQQSSMGCTKVKIMMQSWLLTIIFLKTIIGQKLQDKNIYVFVMHCKLSWYICIYSDNLGCQVSLFTISILCPSTCSSMAGILCILFVQHTICMYSCMYNWLKYMYWLLFSFYIIIRLQRILIIKLHCI